LQKERAGSKIKPGAQHQEPAGMLQENSMRSMKRDVGISDRNLRA
jgi:hypothetical protein